MSASTSREVRQRQYERAQEALKKREESLAESGRDPSSMGKDSVLRKLKAELRQARSRLGAIDGLQEQLRKAAEQKKAKMSEAKPKKEKKDKKAESVEEPVQQKKAKGEKKDKKK